MMINYDDTRSENQHQIALIKWTRDPETRKRYPDLEAIYHIPNEMKCDTSHRWFMNNMGVQAGIPDLCLPVARGKYHALYIEMKTLKRGSKPSDRQLYWIQRLRELGNAAEVCYGDQAATDLLIRYMELDDGESL